MGTTWPIVAPPPFDGGDDQERLVWMLETIRQTLYDLVHYYNDFPLIPDNQVTRFVQNWGEVDASFQNAILTIRKNHRRLVRRLVQAGMTGPMLELKADSLQRCIDGLYREVQTSSPIFSLKWLKPTSKCMNTIIGSLLRTVPGLEVAKEYKDHFEVLIDTVEAAKSK
jgi:hypothetical protein